MKLFKKSIRFFSQAYKPVLLSPGELRDYDYDGFVVCKELLTKSEKENLFKWTDEIQAWPDEKGKWMSYYETDKSTGKKILARRENFLPYLKGMEQLVYSKLTQICSDILREQAVIYKEKVNFKFSGGGGFAAHQDAPAFATYGVNYHITLMISIDRSNKENGALEIVRGKHGEGLLPQTDKLTIKPEVEKKLNFEVIDTEPGDIVVFGSYTPHRSGPNFSNKSRRVHYITFNRLADGSYRDQYFADKRRLFPPENERLAGMDYNEGKKVFNLGNPID